MHLQEHSDTQEDGMNLLTSINFQFIPGIQTIHEVLISRNEACIPTFEALG